MKRLLVLCLCVLKTYGEEWCTNKCEDRVVDWCGKKKLLEGDLKQCTEWTSDGYRCMSPCQKNGEKYTWCQTGSLLMKDAFWGYCAPQGMSARGKECVRECTFEKYWWCRTNEDDEDEWDYCSPPNMVKKVEYSSNGQECAGECAQQGEDYWWCKKPVRFSTGKVTDPDWDYCSPRENITSDGKPCVDECDTRGEEYFWCNTDDGSWGYCSPQVVTTDVSETRDGSTCSGICNNYASNYQYCTTLDHKSDWWDYCGNSLK